jgi:hypothetical protein
VPSLTPPFTLLAQNYPRRDAAARNESVYQYVETVMAQNYVGGTPCCVQMSQALNLSGLIVPSASFRRNNAYLTINGTGYYYFGAVDELEDFLTNQCAGGFAGELVTTDGSGNARSAGDIQQYLQGRQGILAFRDMGAGAHTELWDGHDILQQDIDRGWCFHQPRILFWDAGPPQWLTDAVAAG